MSIAPDRLRRFVAAADALIARSPGPQPGLRSALAELVAHDDWLPEACSLPHPEHYRQYLLHADPAQRYSLVSFVWGPGQATPVHDHTVWGYVGMLRGAEINQPYRRTAQGGYAPAGPEALLAPGDIAAFEPPDDIHQVRNAYADRTSISIHLYGGNIGSIERSVFDPATGQAKRFVSGYS